MDEILRCGHIQMKALEQHFPVILFVMLNELILTLESVYELLIQWCLDLTKCQGTGEIVSLYRRSVPYILLWPG